MAEIDSTQGASRKAFVEWMTSTYPKAYSEYRANEFWENGHISSLVWQYQEARFAALVAESEALRKDAERYRWLCDGNGYFMEEEMLCGRDNEKEQADAAIDQARGAV